MFIFPIDLLLERIDSKNIIVVFYREVVTT